jgi:hypothetical protein
MPSTTPRRTIRTTTRRTTSSSPASAPAPRPRPTSSIVTAAGATSVSARSGEPTRPSRAEPASPAPRSAWRRAHGRRSRLTASPGRRRPAPAGGGDAGQSTCFSARTARGRSRRQGS